MMLRNVRRFALGLMALAISGTAQAEEATQAGAIEIVTAWARASIGTSRPGVAYATIRNTGDQADRLLRVETAIADHAMLHESVQEDNVMKMKPSDGVDLPPQSEAVLAPGGTHIMLMDLKEALVEGDQLPLTFVFQKAGSVEVDATIGSIAANQAPE